MKLLDIHKHTLSPDLLPEEVDAFTEQIRETMQQPVIDSNKRLAIIKSLVPDNYFTYLLSTDGDVDASMARTREFSNFRLYSDLDPQTTLRRRLLAHAIGKLSSEEVAQLQTQLRDYEANWRGYGTYENMQKVCLDLGTRIYTLAKLLESDSDSSEDERYIAENFFSHINSYDAEARSRIARLANPAESYGSVFSISIYTYAVKVNSWLSEAEESLEALKEG